MFCVTHSLYSESPDKHTQNYEIDNLNNFSCNKGQDPLVFCSVGKSYPSGEEGRE